MPELRRPDTAVAIAESQHPERVAALKLALGHWVETHDYSEASKNKLFNILDNYFLTESIAMRADIIINNILAHVIISSGHDNAENLLSRLKDFFYTKATNHQLSYWYLYEALAKIDNIQADLDKMKSDVPVTVPLANGNNA